MLDNISAGSTGGLRAPGENTSTAAECPSLWDKPRGVKSVRELLRRQSCWRGTPCSQLCSRRSPGSVVMPFLRETFASVCDKVLEKRRGRARHPGRLCPGASLRLPWLPAASPRGEPQFPSRKPPFPSPTACLPSPSPFSLAFRWLSLPSPAFHSGQEPRRALLIGAERALAFPLAPAVTKAEPGGAGAAWGTRSALVTGCQRPEGKAGEGRGCGGSAQSLLIPAVLGTPWFQSWC